MYCASEPTHVFRMNAFIGNSSRKVRRTAADLKCFLDFDQTILEDISTQLSDTSVKDIDSSLQEANVLKWKSDVAKYEAQVQFLEVELKQSFIESTKQINLEKHEKEQCQEKTEELRTQLKLLYEKEKHLETENSEMLEKLNKMESEVVSLKKEMAASDSNKQEKNLELELELCSYKEKVFDLKTKLQTNQTELSEMKILLSSSKKQLIAAHKQIETMKVYETGMENSYKMIKELEQKLSPFEDEAILKKNLKLQLSKMEELEKEVEMLRVDNTYLKNNQENTAVIKEKLDSAQKKIGRYEQHLSQYSTMECNYKVAKQQLQQWQSLDDGRSSSNTLVTTQESTIKQLQNEVQRLQLSLAFHDSKNQQIVDQIRSWQKRCYRISAERDGYQQIIASYDHESTIMNSDSIMRTRINTLEQMVANLRQNIETQESSLKTTTNGQAGQLNPPEPMTSRMLQSSSAMSTLRDVNEKSDLQFREKIAELEKNLEETLKKNDYLEMKLEEQQLQGDYNPTKPKVIHMNINPSSVDQQKRREKISTMQDEIDRFQARVKVLEQSTSEAADVTLQVEQKLQEGCNCNEVVEFRSQLESSDQNNKRLLQTYKKTSQEVKKTTHRLMGYHISITGTNIYKLSNIYSESPEDYLLFQRGPSGELQLLETSFSIELYLEKQDSIPAYLSSITLDLFSRHTDTI